MIFAVSRPHEYLSFGGETCRGGCKEECAQNKCDQKSGLAQLSDVPVLLDFQETKESEVCGGSGQSTGSVVQEALDCGAQIRELD